MADNQAKQKQPPPTETHFKLQAALPFLPGHQFNLEKAVSFM